MAIDTNVEIRIPAPLQGYAGGVDTLTVSAATVREALTAAGAAYPDLTPRILTRGGGLRTYVNLYLGQDDVRALDGLDTAVAAGNTLHIVPSVAGG